MKYHFDENRIEKKIEILEEPKKIDLNDTSTWNSFSQPMTVVPKRGHLYGSVNEELDLIKLDLFDDTKEKSEKVKVKKFK